VASGIGRCRYRCGRERGRVLLLLLPGVELFASAAHAERSLEQHAEVRGEVITMGDAAHAGHAVFGDVLVDV
jgi:hypothetical protein